jgi:hypothetical protein
MSRSSLTCWNERTSWARDLPAQVEEYLIRCEGEDRGRVGFDNVRLQCAV